MKHPKNSKPASPVLIDSGTMSGLTLGNDTLQAEVDVLILALRDLLAFHDKVTGEKSDGGGWTAADVVRMAQIRDLAETPLIFIHRTRKGKQ